MNIPASGIQPAEPLSREDALSKRLKSLREQRDTASRSVSEEPPPPYTETSCRAHSEPPPAASPSAKEAKGEERADEGDQGAHQGGEEDKTLDQILDSLVLEDDHWSVSEEGGEDDSNRVEELLARLQSDPEAKTSSAAGDHPGDPERDEQDDDSEGEDMSRKVDDVLSRTMDELNLEGPREPDEPSEPPDHGTAKAPKADTAAADTTLENHHDKDDPSHAPPAEPQTPTQDEPPLPDLPTTTLSRDEDAGLRLPAVPTALQDPVFPPPSQQAGAGDPFESSIAARLAALKGPGHKPIATDAFGLPSAPTFQPEDRSTEAVAGTGGKLGSVAGYTDDDQKTWCIVCLEDATVRCAGCDDDVYCARCWREMHVGPAAGYDERGHRWEKFDPRVR